tara:strand:+ start:1902 stop:2108 length:207 start_codon:yes stop_codon:yes gene_type:complete
MTRKERIVKIVRDSSLNIIDFDKAADKILDLFNVSEWYHCQSEIEGDEECNKQCDHCREYYRGTDNGR